MRFIQAYPSFLSWALALICFALVERVVRRTNALAALTALTLLIAILLLSHILTASWVIGMVGLRGLYAVAVAWRIPFRQGQVGPTPTLRDSATMFGKILAAIMCCVLSLLWPYYSLFLVANFGTVEDGAIFGDHPFHFMLAVYTLGLIAAIPAVKAGRHLFWIVAFVATTGVWIVFHIAGIHFGDRYVFFMAFFPQVIIADAASLAIERVWLKTPNGHQRRFARMGAGMYLAALCAAIIWTT